MFENSILAIQSKSFSSSKPTQPSGSRKLEVRSLKLEAGEKLLAVSC